MNPANEPDEIDEDELNQLAFDAEIESRIARERERVYNWENYNRNLLHRLHAIVFCSECGRVSVWASRKVAEPQRNWHELQHLEGVIGKQTVVRVEVIPE